MRFCVLGSGSKGNCTLFESATTSILIDAGFSGVEIQRRLARIGRRSEDIHAILITHEHRDHVSGVGVLSRRNNIPVYANVPTYRAAETIVGDLYRAVEFETGESFVINDLEIHPFSISHDTADPVGFVITDGITIGGYCTDIGKITRLTTHHLKRCQGLVLESNHDPLMLQEGPYPFPLKQRVRSSQGHLANHEAGELLCELSQGVLQQVILAHLSETNNLPELALQTVTDILFRDNRKLAVLMSNQDVPSDIVEII
jgi:phosphoribosyl 1,2-cyclic phosphodiesterase